MICLTCNILSRRGLFLALVLGACATYQPGALDPEAYLARARRHARHALASTICACRAPHNVVHVDLALGVIQIEENAVVAHAQTELGWLAPQWSYVTLEASSSSAPSIR